MTDYIQWLLEEVEESPPEEDATAQSFIPRRKPWRRFGLPRSASQNAENVRPASVLPERIQRDSVGEAAGWPTKEGSGKGEAYLTERLNGSNLHLGTTAVTRVISGAATSEGSSERDALRLFNALQKVERTERFLQSTGGAASVIVAEDSVTPRVENLGPLELDRCFEREARRYDNGFSLL